MDNITNIHRKKKNKNFRYNDSIGKYKNKILRQKPKIESNQNKFEKILINLEPRLEDNSTELNEKDKFPNYHQSIKPNFTNTQRTSLSVPKYHILKSSTPRRNILRRKNIYMNTPKTLNDSSYLKTANNFTQIIDTDRHNKYNEFQNSKVRHYSFRPVLTSNDFIYNTKTSNNFGVNLNNILTKQNKELRHKQIEMRNKLNDYLNKLNDYVNKIKIMRMENQKLNSEKKKIIYRKTEFKK